jgi:ATP-dependent RNA helicase DDX41
MTTWIFFFMSADHEDWDKELKDHEPYVPLKQRRQHTIKSKKRPVQNDTPQVEIQSSLLDQILLKATPAKTTEQVHQEQQDAILHAIHKQQTQHQTLQSTHELAHGVIYTQPMPSSHALYAYINTYRWRPPRHVREFDSRHIDDLRTTHHLIVEGVDVVPPITTFRVSPLVWL